MSGYFAGSQLVQIGFESLLLLLPELLSCHGFAIVLQYGG